MVEDQEAGAKLQAGLGWGEDAVRGEDGDWRCLPDVKNLETILDFMREIPHIFPILRWK